MHLLAIIAQAIGDTAGKITLDHISTGLLIMQQIQLSQMKVKVNALWDKFLGVKATADVSPDDGADEEDTTKLIGL